MSKRRSSSATTARAERPAGMRVDRWLFCARVTKTRAEAARLVAAGAVRINRVKIGKPATAVHVGDVLTIVRHRRVRVVRIRALVARRVPARLVPDLLEEL